VSMCPPHPGAGPVPGAPRPILHPRDPLHNSQPLQRPKNHLPCPVGHNSSNASSPFH